MSSRGMIVFGDSAQGLLLGGPDGVVSFFGFGQQAAKTYSMAALCNSFRVGFLFVLDPGSWADMRNCFAVLDREWH